MEACFVFSTRLRVHLACHRVPRMVVAGVRVYVCLLLGTYSPPNLCRFATQGLLPLRWRWGAASPRPVCVWLCEDL